MTLSNFETCVPYKILTRGEDYYYSGTVSDLEEHEPGEWTATVSGTEKYEVEISLEGDEIVSWLCDCPYDGEICKHVVAVLMEIRDHQRKVERFLSANEVLPIEEARQVPPKMNRADNEIKQILSFVKPEQLSAFVLEYGSLHTDFKTALMDKFLQPQKIKASSTDYKEEIGRLFDYSYVNKKRYSRYWEQEIDWDKVESELDGYLAKAQLLLKHEGLEEAADIALQILRSIGENYIEEDLLYLDNIDFPTTCETAGALLLRVVESPKASEALKKQILQEAVLIEKLVTYREYDVYDMDDLVQQIIFSVQSKEEALVHVNKMMEEGEERYDFYKLVYRKIEILQALNRADEAKAVLRQYLYLPKIRQDEVEKLVRNKCYHEALQMLDKGIAITSKEKNDYGTLNWMKSKLSIYETLHDVPRCIELCRLLFIKKNGDLVYYEKLKSMIPSSDWKTYLAALMKETRSFYGDAEAQIYLKEKDYAQLFEWILRNTYRSLEVLLQYGPSLNATHSEQILAMFVEELRDYAAKNMGRSHYEFIARCLKEMTKMNGGPVKVNQLADEFRTLYKRRPAMMETLKGF